MNEYRYIDIDIGKVESFSKVISKEDENYFRTITGDINPLHSDDDFAIETSAGKYKRHVAFGMLTASLLSTLAGVYLPGKYSLIHSIDSVRFKKPVFAGDELTVVGEVVDKQDGLNLILVKAKIINKKKTVMTANMKILVQK